MPDTDLNTQKLLQRTSLKVSFSNFLASLQSIYPQIGVISSYTPILVGYEAANFILESKYGRFVLKIFESNRPRENINNLIQILIEAPKVGVPTLELVSGLQGNLSVYNEDGIEIPYYITKYWEGESFEKHTPTNRDISQVTEYLACLNTLNFPVTEVYDAWGNKNLVKEYVTHSEAISNVVKEKVAPVVEEFKSIDFHAFSQGVIHGDMQRKHVLKNTKGEYCILDFGCMSHDAKVIDLSTYLAWFCLGEDNWANNKQIIHDVLEIYNKTHSLSQAEVEALPILIRAAYAAYFLTTSLLIDEGDVSLETRNWHQSAERLLDLAKNL